MHGHVNCQPKMHPKPMKNMAAKRIPSALSHSMASKLARPSFLHKQFNVADYVYVNECLDQLGDRFNFYVVVENDGWEYGS